MGGGCLYFDCYVIKVARAECKDQTLKSSQWKTSGFLPHPPGCTPHPPRSTSPARGQQLLNVLTASSGIKLHIPVCTLITVPEFSLSDIIS